MRRHLLALAARFGRRWSLWLVSLVTLLIIGGWALDSTPILGAAGDIGYRGFSFGFTQGPGGNPDNGPTATKPQSKLWFNDGAWWGVLLNPSGQYRIYQLNVGNQKWTDTGTAVDSRRYSHADALWDGTRLYIATAVQPGTGDADVNARVLRFSYNRATRTYAMDAGFPIVVTSTPLEAIVLDKDTTGALWVTYTQDNGSGGRSVYVTHTSANNDTNWVAPYVVPAEGATTLATDDISTIVAYRGRIGVMWSNQNDDSIYFASHADGAADNQWQQNPALQSPQYADDHVNLKALQVDQSGQVFAVVKTSLGDNTNPNPGAPLVLLLILDNQGSWSRRTFGTVADDHTRPILSIDEANRYVYVFATSNNGTPPSGIYYKRAALDNINFPTGLGTAFLLSDADTNINNATAKKGSVNGTTNLVVLASDLTTGNYWHNVIDLPATGPTPTPGAGGFRLYLPVVMKDYYQ